MTRDYVLGWILILMVGISLFLSFAIWSRIPGEQSAEKKVQEEKRVDMATVASPGKILVHLGNASHTLFTPSSSFYDKAWNYSKKAISAIWVGAKAMPVDVGADFFEQKAGLEIVFPNPLPVPFVKRLFNIEAGDEVNFNNIMLSSYSLVEDGGLWAYLKDSDGRYYRINKSGDSVELSALLKEVSESNPPLFAAIPPGSVNLKISRGIYVPLLPHDLPQYGVKHEKVINDRLAARFFADFSVARKIEERDGAVIYTDGQRALRIYHDGTLEYSFPGVKEQKKNVSFYDALKTAVDFISIHGGWPQGAFLSSYDISSGLNGTSYNFKFGIRINGYPVVSEKEYLSVTVDGSQVKSFYRNMAIADKPGQIREMISPIKAMDIAVSTRNIKSVEDIYPAYVMDSGEYIPTWVIKSQGHDIIIRNFSE
jgi:regulatory protein YycH of two-component signal transduction system YycFG